MAESTISFQTKLQNTRGDILHTLKPDDIELVIKRLTETAILTDDQKLKLRSEKDSTKKAVLVLDIIISGGKETHDEFFAVLTERNHSSLRHRIDESKNGDYVDGASPKQDTQLEDIMRAMKVGFQNIEVESLKSRQEIKQLKTQVERFSEIRDDENEKLKDENKTLQHEISLLREELDNARRDKVMDMNKLAELEAKRKEFQKKGSSREKNSKELKRENAEMKMEIQSLKDGLTRLRAHNERHKPMGKKLQHTPR